MIGMENYCLACDRQVVPPTPAVYVRERGPALRLPVLLGVLWGPVLLALLAVAGFVVDGAWS